MKRGVRVLAGLGPRDRMPENQRRQMKHLQDAVMVHVIPSGSQGNIEHGEQRHEQALRARRQRAGPEWLQVAVAKRRR